MLTPKGATVRREIGRYVVDEELRRGYQHVVTPPLARTDLYKMSGHYPLLQRHHVSGHESRRRRIDSPPHDLPSPFHAFQNPRPAVIASCLFDLPNWPLNSGMKKRRTDRSDAVRMFTLSDAHIFCTKDQAVSVIGEVLDLIQDANSVFGLKKGEDYRYRLSLGDRETIKSISKTMRLGFCRNVLRQTLETRHEPYFDGPEKRLFMDPKLTFRSKKPTVIRRKLLSQFSMTLSCPSVLTSNT